MSDVVVADRAVAWARARLGSTEYATRCLAFVEDAVERANDLEVFGGDSAAESAGMFASQLRQGPPEFGGFAFYAAEGVIGGIRGEWGHVGLSVGDGRVIHAWDRVRLDAHRDIEALRPAPGWTAPRWLGWVAIGDVIATARPRRWDDDERPEDAARRLQEQRFGAAADG